MTDSRGWTLLHLATESRSLELLVDLIGRGCDPAARTDPSGLGVPKGLDYIAGSPLDIAVACGNEDVYLQALANTPPKYC